MSTPTATPRTDAALYPMNGVEIVWPYFARQLETELAEAKAEAAHYMSVAQKATDDLTRLRADNLTAHQMACAAGLERDQLRAEVERLDAEKPWLKEANARAAHAEAALAEWSVLNLWGGTPEIIHEFIKGQQNRIHHCQDLEAECLKQARLLGMSGEREADLLGKIERLAKDKARLDWLEANPEAVKSSSVFKSTFGRKVWWRGAGGDYDTARAAIDAAMKGTT